jgi:rod shape determining protein RodA
MLNRKDRFIVDVQLVMPVLIMSILSTLTLWGFAQNGVRLVDGDLIMKHVISIGIGFVAMVVVALIDYRTMKSSTRFLYGVSVLLLLLVLIFGREVNGARSWFRLGPVSFQPVEMVKIVVVLALAKYIALYHRFFHEYRFVVLSAIPIFVIIFLIMLQPDLGSAMIIFLTWFVMIVIGGIRKRYVFLMLVSFAVLSVLAWSFYLAEYQKDRVRVFIDPGLDPQGSGYNTLQAMEAIQSGGWFGFEASGPRDLVYVPEVQTDFIFAGYAQEWGFVGVSAYFALFSFLMFRLYRYIQSTPDSFTRLVVSGVLVVIGIQSCINVGMNLGLMPVTGIPLPFMSYGGTSMVFSWIMIGVVQSIHQAKETKLKQTFDYEIL